MARRGGLRWIAPALTVAALGVAALAHAQLPGVQMGESTAPRERTPEDVIRDQLRAFNAHDADALAANLAETFAWFAVDSDVTTLQMQGRGPFRDSMRQYFASVPGVRAEIEELFATGNFVSTRERAYWMQNGVETSQVSIAVYEVRDGIIYRVWYYPAFQ